MTALTEDEAIEKFVSKSDVRRYKERHPRLWEKLKKLRRTNISRYQNNIRRIKKAILAAKIRDMTGSDLNISGAVAEWQIVYGTTRVAGVRTFAGISASGAQLNAILHLLITFAAHEITAIDQVYLDGERVVFDASPDDRWSTYIEKENGVLVVADHRVFHHLNYGTADQVANDALEDQMPEFWTAAHRQRGRAGCYLIFVWDPILFPNMPTIEFLVRGKPLYDPRIDDYEFSDNAALVVADFMMNTEWGCGIPADRIDMVALGVAAEICDETVIVLSGAEEKKFTINGVIQTSSSRQNTLETLLSHMSGNAVYSNGKWKIYAADWRGPSILSITEDDILGPIHVSVNPSRKDTFNRVRGTFTDSANAYTEADFPPVKNAYYLAQDNGEEVWEDIQLPLAVTAAHAQRIGKLELEKTRAGLTVSFAASLRCWKAEPCDIIDITNDKLGWAAKLFEVIDIQPVDEESASGSPVMRIQITAKETAEAVFDLSAYETNYDSTPNTTLPNPFYVPTPTGLVLESGTDHLYLLGDGTIITRIYVQWDEAPDIFITGGGEVHVWWKLSSDETPEEPEGDPKGPGDWQRITSVPGSAQHAYIWNAIDGESYDILVQFRNAIGAVSDFASYENYIVVGKTEPPSNVQGFRGSLIQYGVRLEWDAVPDADVREYEIRIGNSNATWEEAQLLWRGSGLIHIAELQLVGSYLLLIKALDTSGNYSLTATPLGLTVPIPAAPVTEIRLDGDSIIFEWEPPSSQYAIEEYEISFAVVTELNPTPAYANSTLLVQTKATIQRLKVTWGGTRYFWVAARDVAGNLGIPYLVTFTVTSPVPPEIWRADVVDNNVLLYWRDSHRTLPVVRYIITQGEVFTSSESKGEVRGTFIALFETSGGVYRYWIVAEDSAGNRSLPSSIVLSVNQPPDYVLVLEGALDPRDAAIAENVFIEGFGFVGSPGSSGSGGVGSPIGILLSITQAVPPIGGIGPETGEPIGILLSVTKD